MILIALMPASVLAADGKSQSRMVFEPGSKKPNVHTDADGKPVGDGVEKSAPTPNPEEEGGKADAKTASEPAMATLPAPPPAPANMPPELARTLNIFFGQLIKGNIDIAYTSLTKGTVLEREPATLTSLKSSTSEAQKLFGAFRGYEILSVEEVGIHMLRVSCVSLGELFPLSWKFFYYRPDGEWRLIDIRVGAALNEFFPGSKAGEPKSSSRAAGDGK